MSISKQRLLLKIKEGNFQGARFAEVLALKDKKSLNILFSLQIE